MGKETKRLTQNLMRAEDAYRDACEAFENATKTTATHMRNQIAAGATGKITYAPELGVAREKLYKAEHARRVAREALHEFLDKKSKTNKKIHSLKMKFEKFLP
jgi:hypothetical protein